MPDPAGELVHLAVEAADALTEVMLIDHKLRRVAVGVGRLDGDFSPGFYKLKSAVGGRFEEKLIELAPGQEPILLPPVRLQSAAPLAGEAPAAHLEGAVECSRKAHRSIGFGGQVFLFVRDPEGEEGAQPWRGVSIQTAAGRRVLDLEKEGDRSEAAGFAGVTGNLDPGPYVLSVDTRVWGVQQMSLVVSPGWQTQVFLNARRMERRASGSAPDAPPERTSRRADLFTASISMSPLGQGFDPESRSVRLVEMARLALERGRDLLRSGEIREVLWNNPSDPMLGLLLGHLLLLSKKPDVWVLDTVSENLRAAELQQHPDLLALELALGKAGPRFQTPPLLRPGWRRIVKETAARTDLIPPNSPAYRIASHVIGNSTWLVWRRPGSAEEKRETRDVMRGGADSRRNRGALERDLRWISQRIESRNEPTRSLPAQHFSVDLPEDDDLSVSFRGTGREAGPRLDFLERNLLQVIESSVGENGGRPPEVEELVQALGLPAANIEDLLERVVRKKKF